MVKVSRSFMISSELPKFVLSCRIWFDVDRRSL